MRRLLRAARQKVRAQSGFSLAETLVAMALLTIMSSAAALGVSQALKQRNHAIALADAQTVASTAAQVITDQLRYGRIDPAHTGGDTAVLASGTYGAPVCVTLDGNGYLTTGAASLSGGAVSQGTVHAMLSADAYCGLRLADLTFTAHTAGDTVKSVDVSFAVTSASSEDSLWNLEFSVAPINQRTFTLE